MAEPFKFDPMSKEVPEVEDLTNGERELLRGLAEPGNPLWKIMRKIVDYREGLTQSLLSVKFNSPESLEAARQTQAAALSIHWLEQFMAAALTDVDEPQEGDENVRREQPV